MSTPEIPPTSPPPVAKGKRAFVATATALGILGLGLGGAYAYATKLGTPDRIAPGIRIGDAAVSGLTRVDAEKKMEVWTTESLQKTIVFTAPATGRKWSYTLADLGGKFDSAAAVDKAFAVGKDDNMFEKLYWGSRERGSEFTPALALDTKKIDEALKIIAAEVESKPRNARARMDAKGALTISQHAAKGCGLDLATTKASLLKRGMQSLAGGAETKIVIVETRPKVTDDDLGKIGTLMGSYTSDYSSSSGDRQHNVELAASHIDGTILGPGEEFSYNKIVGPREPGYGWRMGHMYSNGTVIDSLGGGVCQVSSTLYNATLFADLKITMRRCHLQPGPVPPGGPRRHGCVGLPGLPLPEQHRRPDLPRREERRGPPDIPGLRNRRAQAQDRAYPGLGAGDRGATAEPTTPRGRSAPMRVANRSKRPSATATTPRSSPANTEFHGQ